MSLKISHPGLGDTNQLHSKLRRGDERKEIQGADSSEKPGAHQRATQRRAVVPCSLGLQPFAFAVLYSSLRLTCIEFQGYIMGASPTRVGEKGAPAGSVTQQGWREGWGVSDALLAKQIGGG